MTRALPEPTDAPYDTERRLCDYLDYFRSAVASKAASLPAAELRSSRLRSGWSPLELVNHLVHMERRWLVWGFLAESVEGPWDDSGPDGRWVAPAGMTLRTVLDSLDAGGQRTRQIVREHPLTERGRIGGRFDSDPPTLEWILLHVLQEYARHAGHLDVVTELGGGNLGE